MANMMDYLAWRGDLSLAVSPWCGVDRLIMASFSYNVLSCEQAASEEGIALHEMAPLLDLPQRTGNVYFEQWRTLLYTMAETPRFMNMRVHHYVDIVDAEQSMQFSAYAADMDDGSTFVAFRGTDSTLVGWREDFDMSYESPVPAQTSAVKYLEGIAERRPGKLRISGHSKGGNLAAYAAAHASPEVQARIDSVYSFDGPGLDDDTMASEGYANILPVLHSVIPQASVVGLLMNYHANYTVVKSLAISLWQHDAFKWQVLGTDFVPGERTGASVVMDETLHEWLKACTPAERKEFVEALFDVLDSTDANTLAELSGEKIKSAAMIISGVYAMKPEMRKMFLRLLGMFLSMTATNAAEMFDERRRDSMTERRKTLIERRNAVIEMINRLKQDDGENNSNNNGNNNSTDASNSSEA